MPKLKQMDRATARLIGEKAQQALQKAMVSFGLDVTRGNARYDSGQVTIKFEFALPKAKAASKAQDSQLLGFNKNIIGMQFAMPGKRGMYTIVDIHLSKPKYPIIAETARGARYKFSVAQMVRYLGKQVKFKGFLPTQNAW